MLVILLLFQTAERHVRDFFLKCLLLRLSYTSWFLEASSISESLMASLNVTQIIQIQVCVAENQMKTQQNITMFPFLHIFSAFIILLPYQAILLSVLLYLPHIDLLIF